MGKKRRKKMKQWKKYVKALRKRYHKSGTYIPPVRYEVWNEPAPIGSSTKEEAVKIFDSIKGFPQYQVIDKECHIWVPETEGGYSMGKVCLPGCAYEIGHPGPCSMEKSGPEKYANLRPPAIEAQSVVDDRMKKYGPPVEHFNQVANMWSAYIGHSISAEDVCHMMVIMKQTREKFSHNRDNEVDAHGYLICAELCAAEARNDV